MKTISRRICGGLLGLCVLAMVCVLAVMVRGAGADDAADWAHQQAQAQREREEWQRQQEQAQRERDQTQRDYDQRERDRQAAQDWQTQREQAQKERDDWYKQQAQAQRDYEQAERDRQARDDWYKQQAQAQKERDEWYSQQAQAQKEREQAQSWQAQKDREDGQAQRDYQQSILDGIERVKQQRDEILARAYGTQPESAGGWPAGGRLAAAAKAPVARSIPRAQVRLPAAPPRRSVPLNPIAFQQMVRQNQERVRQQIMQTRQQMMPGSQEAPQPQLIQNPFVGSPQQITPARPESPQVIQNPFVGPST